MTQTAPAGGIVEIQSAAKEFRDAVEEQKKNLVIERENKEKEALAVEVFRVAVGELKGEGVLQQSDIVERPAVISEQAARAMGSFQ